MIAVDVQGYTVVEVDDASGSYYRTEGLGRSLHPEIAVSGLTLATAQEFLAARVEEIMRGAYLDLPGGSVSWQGQMWTYQWKPELFVFLFADRSHPSM